MKLQTCLIVLAVSLSCIICDVAVASSPASKQSTFVRKVPDGYVLTVSQRVFKKIKNNGDFAVTFFDAGGQKNPDPKMIKKALSDRSKHCTLEGKATKVGKNEVKISTSSTLTVNLSRPFGVYWGLGSSKLSDWLTNGIAPGDPNCGTCSGVKGFVRVQCTDPNSVICCENCQ